MVLKSGSLRNFAQFFLFKQSSMGNCQRKGEVQQYRDKARKPHWPAKAVKNSDQFAGIAKNDENQVFNQTGQNLKYSKARDSKEFLSSSKNISTKGTEDIFVNKLDFETERLQDIRRTDGGEIPYIRKKNQSMKAAPSVSAVRQEPEIKNLKIHSETHINIEENDELAQMESTYCKTEQSVSIVINFMSYLDEQTKKELDFLSTKEFEQKVKQVNLQTGHPNQHFTFKKKLGDGGNCKVYLVERRNCPTQKYAVRYMEGKKDSFVSRVCKQIAMMDMCKSDNILRYHFSYVVEKKIYMFVEYMNGGSLFDFIQGNKRSIPENTIAYILKKVLRGLNEVHKKHQIHRDIKSQNILLSTQGDIKICDFGAVAQLTKEKTYSNGFQGTILWMAPEIIKKKTYTEKIDIWSLGILAIELCTGSAPHEKLNCKVILKKIVEQQPPTVHGKSQNFRDFLSHCLQKDPEKRWTCPQLLKHPFITGLGSQAIQKQNVKNMVKNRRVRR